MLLQLSYGLGRDKDSDGDGLKYIGELVTAKYKSCHAEITVVPHDLYPPIGIVTKPFCFLGHSAGAGAAEKWAKAAGVPIELMILSDTFPLLTDGKIVADDYTQPAFVERLVALRQTAGILQGKPVRSGHNYIEYVLPPIDGQTGIEPHTGLCKRPEVINIIMNEIIALATKFNVT